MTTGVARLRGELCGLSFELSESERGKKSNAPQKLSHAPV